jgi:GDSL-like lipase/acylhydrolase family protein
MPHLVLLGDSILDNGAYTGPSPAVVTQVQRQLPDAWKATLLAVDGSTTRDVERQLRELPSDTTHMVLSIGGNDALQRSDILNSQVATGAEAFSLLYGVVRKFEANYRSMLEGCLAHRLPLLTCTIYNGNFPDRHYQQCVSAALTAFNDVIMRAAMDSNIEVLDLRSVCSSVSDYANTIEPSSRGGEKIAAAIVDVVARAKRHLRSARVYAYH